MKLAPLILILLAACSTPSSPPDINVARTAQIVGTSARLGTFYAISQDAQLRSVFVQVATAVESAVKSGYVEPIQLRMAIAGVGMPSQVAAPVNAALGPALDLFDYYATNEVPPKDRTLVRPVAEAFRDGIKRGVE